MFEFQIKTPTDLNDVDFSSSEYVLQKGELFGIPGIHENNGNRQRTASKLYIGNGETPIKGLRYIGQDIDGGTFTGKLYSGTEFMDNMKLSKSGSGKECIEGNSYVDSDDALPEPTASIRKMAIWDCNIVEGSRLKLGISDDKMSYIRDGEIHDAAFISGNKNTDIKGGKIAGSTILFKESLNTNGTTFTNIGYIGNQGEPGQEKFFSSTGYPSTSSFFEDGYILRCLDIKGKTVINEDGTFKTSGATIQNSNLTTGNTFPSYINTNVNSANYLSLNNTTNLDWTDLGETNGTLRCYVNNDLFNSNDIYLLNFVTTATLSLNTNSEQSSMMLVRIDGNFSNSVELEVATGTRLLVRFWVDNYGSNQKRLFISSSSVVGNYNSVDFSGVNLVKIASLN